MDVFTDDGLRCPECGAVDQVVMLNHGKPVEFRLARSVSWWESDGDEGDPAVEFACLACETDVSDVFSELMFGG